MPRLVTVTLNPAIDKTLRLPALIPGSVHRATIERVEIGGKGINVAHALRVLGHTDVTPLLLTPDALRVNLTILTADGTVTKINEPGSPPPAAAITRLWEQIDAAQPDEVWALCGSLPPGLPADFYARIARRLTERQALVYLDTSGDALRHGVTAPLFMLKINGEEAADLLGEPVTFAGGLAAAAALQQRYPVGGVALTFGAEGLVIRAGQTAARQSAPAIAAVNPVGAGDAVLAGLIDGMEADLPIAALAAWMAACGASAAQQTGSGIGSLAEIRAIYQQMME